MKEWCLQNPGYTVVVISIICWMVTACVEAIATGKNEPIIKITTKE